MLFVLALFFLLHRAPEYVCGMDAELELPEESFKWAPPRRSNPTYSICSRVVGPRMMAPIMEAVEGTQLNKSVTTKRQALKHHHPNWCGPHCILVTSSS